MPSAHMPLRPHPSLHNMRQVDGLRQHRPEDMKAPSKPNDAHSNIAFEKILPPIGVHDFQGHHFPSSRRPMTANGNSVSRARFQAPSPAPDHPRDALDTQRLDPHLSNNLRGLSSDPSSHHEPPLPQPPVRQKPRNASRSPSPASRISSNGTYETQATSMELPALQTQSALEETDQMQPIVGDMAGSYDLVEPPEEGHQAFSLEGRSELLFSEAHLRVIFANSSYLLRFTAFLSTHRPQSVPVLIFYLDALKALKAIKYANAVAEALKPIRGHEYTTELARSTKNNDLEEKTAKAFSALAQHDLPAYITQMYVQIVSLSISRRITGTLAPHLREASEGLAEVFCLTDPSRPDNPIVFASDEFNRTTQYGMSYAIGRNCRFLQGPRTNPLSPRRLGDAVRSGKEHCEVFLNYRRDGSPFINMLMIAPLCDSKGKIRYFIGAQVDVSGLVKDCTELESFQELVAQQNMANTDTNGLRNEGGEECNDDFQELSEMFNMAELETVRRYGGRMHREYQEEEVDKIRTEAPHMPRLLLQEPTADEDQGFNRGDSQSGRLRGIYQNYLLIRPYPSFRILFASPTLRVPGILQSPFMDKIGGSSRVHEELSSALAEGRGVTAKVRWLSRPDEDGRNRWIHCTPLVGSNGQIGVWMIVLVDDDIELGRRWKQAPPVAPHRGRVYREDQGHGIDNAESNPARASRSNSVHNEQSFRAYHNTRRGGPNGSLRSTSPSSVLI